MSRASFGKSLKGPGSLSARFTIPIEDAIFNALSTGGIPLENVEITGGTVDGVVIGGNTPGPSVFTTLQSGNSSGQGFSVCFFGQTVGDSACWEPVIGRWNIQGELLVRDTSDLGNLRIFSNTLSSTNTNGNININPNGLGIISLTGGLNHTTPNGNINFNTNNGTYRLSTGGDITLITAGDINLTPQGDINIPDNIGITFGSDTRKIESNGTDIIVDTGIGKLTINGDLQVNGETTHVKSTVTEIDDPIITLGGEPITDDNKDRGIEFRYISGNQSKLGFFGYDDSTGCFTFIPDGTNTNEVFSGALGCIDVGNIKGTGLDLQNGNITNIGSLDVCNINCSGVMNITGSTSINLITPSTTTSSAFISNGDFTANGTTNNINGTITNINSTTTNINSENVNINDNIVSIGQSVTSDKGIEFKYQDGTVSKLGFFGWDDSEKCFTFVPEASNTGNIISGIVGDVCFGDGTFSSINTCNINCNGSLILTSNEIVLNSDNVNINDAIVSIGVSEIDDKDRGIEFKYQDGSVSKRGFFGWDKSDDCFKFLKDTTNTGDIITGTLGDVCFGDTTINNLTVTGTITSSGLSSKEHLNGNGGDVLNPGALVNITFINITGVVTGTLFGPTIDGFEKYILISSLTSGSKYELNCPNGILVDPGSGTSAAKKIIFEYAGQSIYIIWDNVNLHYIIVGGNACIANP